MASMLSLNDDCLGIIVSCLHDPSSFYSFALTCKRFLQATKNTRNVLHPRLLRTKAEYYITRYIVDISSNKKRESYDEYCRLTTLLQDAVRLTAGKKLLSYAKVVDVWQRNGPVAAKLFTWIRKQESSEENGEPRATCSTEYTSVTLRLPSCKKRMVIETSYFHDNGHNYDDELSIHVICGDLDVKSEGFARYSPEDYMYWEEEEVNNAVEPMKLVIELLQSELGDTVPPITGRFFIWLCYFFPDNGTLREENRLSFKETVRNTKPSPDAVQSAMDLFKQDQESETKFQSVVSEWKNKEEESMHSNNMLETIAVLVRRSETKVLKDLEEVASLSYSTATDCDFKLLPQQVLLDLVLRTSLEANTYSPGAVADKYVESSVSFKCLRESKALKVSGGMHGDGASYPSWDELDLKFTLPDGKELKLRTGAVNYRSKERPAAVDQLGPVTELVQRGINQRMQGEKHIPEINNLFTAVYFLHAMKLPENTDTFLGDFECKDLFRMESDEESSAEESDA